MGRRPEPSWSKGLIGLMAARERGDITRKFQSNLTVTRSMIDRLGLEKDLVGHMGCVNCLEWSKDGTILASASDDLHVILWDPIRHKQRYSITTGHTGNIFSVKFLSMDVLATCAADGSVRGRSISTGSNVLECRCHCGRVKRLAVAPESPHLLWSAGEDGLVLQHDLRAPHHCNSDTNNNVLVNLINHLGRYAEAKCISVNPRRPHQLAVGANDFYLRLYDTRMIKLAKLQDIQLVGPQSRMMWERQNIRCSRAGHGDPDDNIPRSSVQYYAPGHLSIDPNEHPFPKKSATYVTFSNDGNEILVNLGSEQVYLFDINAGKKPALVESYIIQHNRSRSLKDKQMPPNGANGTATGANGTTAANITLESQVQLPERARVLKEKANELVNSGHYMAAVELYNEALVLCPDCAILYSNRAAALLRRGWTGDTYAAVQDCYAAIHLDPTHVKSHFRLAKSLMELKRAREAQECLLYFKDRFPRHGASHAVFLLQKDINVAIEGMDVANNDNQSEAPCVGASPLERSLRRTARDYSRRFLGHCNTTTDIKEANFLGPRAEYIAAGSDDGSLFIWCRKSGNIIKCLRGDESIVNCVQLHPSMFLLATSGIEAVVRLWSPRDEEGVEMTRTRSVSDVSAAAAANQQRMRSDPFEAMLLNISYAGASAERDRELHSPACRAT